MKDKIVELLLLAALNSSPVSTVSPTPMLPEAGISQSTLTPVSSIQEELQELPKMAEIPVEKSVVEYITPVQKPQVLSETTTNLYEWGNCTWYVKNRRPELPNSLGNANTWAIRAAAQGMSTGSTPQIGAVAVSTAGAYGHVMLVTGVGDGIITVSEMNVVGLGIESPRTLSSAGLSYIY